MKRSTEYVFYVTPHDFNLAVKGIKTASSRIGDRRRVWPVGHRLALVDNQDENRRTSIEITYNVPMKLCFITPTQAFNIGGYSTSKHYEDFVSVYADSGPETDLSLVGFRVLDDHVNGIYSNEE